MKEELEFIEEKKRIALINFFEKADLKQFITFNEEQKAYIFSFTEKEYMCRDNVKQMMKHIKIK